MGLFDDIKEEVEGQESNTPTSSGVGLFDDIKAEVENTPPQPSFMDNVKDFSGKVLHKGKSVLDNAYNLPFMHDNNSVTDIQQPVQQPIENVNLSQYNPLKPKYNDLFDFKNTINNSELQNTQGSQTPEIIPTQQFNIQPNTVEDRFNTAIITKQQTLSPLEELLYRNTVKSRGSDKIPKQVNDIQEQEDIPNYVDGYSLERANELAKKTFPELEEFKLNNDARLQGRVFESTEFINPNQVSPQQQAGNINYDNGNFNVIEDNSVALNNPENFNLSEKEKANINKKLGLDGFYKNIHSGASKVLNGHDNIKQGIKHLVRAGIGTYTNAYDMLYMLGDKFDNDNLRNFAKQGYLVAEHLQNLIHTDENSEGLNNFFEHPIRNINNLLADSTPLMSMAIGGSIVAGGVATVLSAPAWVVTLAIGTTAWAINSVLQGDYIQKKREMETLRGRKLTKEEINNLQLATGVEKAIVGGLETCVDMLGMNKIIGKIDAGVMNGIKNIVKKGVEQALEEELTEGLQETTSVLAEKSLGINKEGNLKRIAEAGLSGLILGGVMGGAGASLNSRMPVNKTDKVIEKTAPNTYAKQQAKAEEKAQVEQERIEELAPNTMAEQKVKKEIKEQIKETQKRGKHTKDFNKGDIIRDIYSGHIYEVIEPDKRGMGKLRDVDTNEIRTPNAHNNAHYEKYEHDTNDLIEVEEFKYDEKQKRRNAENYMYSKQEVVDAYNEYVKKPTEANKEKYEDVSGQALKEFSDNEESIKNGTFKLHVENTEKGNTNDIVDNEGNTKNKQNDLIYGYNADLRHKIINVGFSESDVNNLIDRLEKGKDLGKYGNLLNTIKDRLYSNDKETFNSLENLHNSFKNIRKTKPLEKSEKIVNNEDKDTNSEVSDDNIRTSATGSKGLSQELSTRLRGVHSDKPYDRRSNSRRHSEIRPKDKPERSSSDLGTFSSTIAEHKEKIEKSYKTQHELNNAIEDFINNSEYNKYNGNIPQEIKDWLKKYAGSGGLEKQGAKGKGLLSEYYTPDNIVKKMWEITSQYINTDGSKVLEPSVGIGRFLEYAPKGASFDVVEMNPVSAKITELLYPDANVTVGQFQEKFIDNTKNIPVKNVTPEYDIVIGNPPYGEYSGRYKGLGEGKKYKTLQAYFINRGLDTLKENGVMTFIVPSSFLDNIGDKVEISSKAELLDAYRLPENTFDTTSIGTDIVVLRKRTGQGQDTNFISGEWFKKHPEKILGTPETRKNRFGKEETFIKGDKNAVEKIDTSEKDIRKTVNSENKVVTKSVITQKNKIRKSSTKKEEYKHIDYEVYQPKNTVSDEEKALYRDTRVDGTLPEDKYSPSEKVNQYKGKLYNDFNYLQGNLYDKLDALETENISDKQKEIQRKKINDVLPAKISISKMEVSPTSDFINDLDIKVENPQYSEYYYGRRKKDNIALRDEKEINLVQGAIQYINSDLVQKDDLKTKTGNTANITRANITKYLQGNTHFDYDRTFKADDQCTPAEKKEKDSYKTQVKSDLREVANKLFVEYLTTLPEEKQKIIQDAYNREFNGYIIPDYLKMPFLVDDVSSTFTNGEPLEFRKEQIEGINFLLNKGVGLLGFDTGVGKTLTSIVAAYQNMKNGYCKRPLMIVQSANQKKWEKEIKALYPNVKVNFLDNLGAKSSFNGEIEDNSITLVPYESLDNIWYNKETLEELETILGNMKVQETDGKLAYQEEMRRAGKKVKGDTERQKEKFKEDIRKMLGIALKGNSNKFKFEDLGFDYITVDEAQNFNNIFTSAKAYNEKGGFNLGQTKDPTQRAVRLFMMTQYVLSHNSNRNVCLLSATPFTNNPTQIFSIFSLIGKDLLDNMHCYNVHQFMETFADMKAVDEIDHKNEIVTKEECRGFKNKKVLYQIRDSLMMMRKGKEDDLDRPNRITIKPTLYPTAQQANILKNVDEYLSTASSEGGRNNARTLQEINIARKATLSPHFAMGNIAETSADTVVKSSPKLEYTCNCIGEQYKADKHSRQIVFMPMGNELFPKMKEYIAKHYDIKENEIATIDGETKSDLIQEYITEFKKLDGKIKVIFGTKTIKEGLDLQDFTTTLYLPLNDWNPTDHKQVVGRFWRHGNNYENIRTVIPLLFDSSDSFQMQKLDNKIKRINDMHYSNTEGEFIDEAELEAEDSALDLIANPEKKTNAFKKYKTRELENKKKALIDRKEAVERYIESKKSKENTIEYYEKENEKLKQEIKEMEETFPKDENGKIIKPSNDWNYNSKVSRLESYKKYYKNAKEELKILESIAKKREYEVNGADNPDVLSSKIAEIEEQVTNLEEIVSKKREEYYKFYEETKAQAKGVKELVDDYIKQTKELYDGFDVVKDGKFTKKKSKEGKKLEDYVAEFEKDTNELLNLENDTEGIDGVDIPEFMKDKNVNIIDFGKDIDLTPVYEGISKGIRGEDLAKILPSEIANYIRNNANNYIFGEMITKESGKRGVHIGKKNAILLNLKALSNSPFKFIQTLIHEIKHANQHKLYLNIMSKPKYNWSPEERTFIAHYNICGRVNKERQIYYNKHKKLIDKYSPNNFYSAEERANAIFQLSKKEQNILRSYKEKFENYWNALYEVEARAEGTKYAEGYKKESRISRLSEMESIYNGTRKKRYLGSDSRNSTNEGENSAEPLEYKQVKNSIRQDKIKIEKATRDSLYKWYGNVEKARYDVDKDLNNFNKITKSTAKDFSNKTGMKVSDKMVREILPFLRERTAVPEALGRKDLLNFYNKLTKEDIARLTKLADNVCSKFDKYWQNYKDAKGIISDEDIENHISHLWNVGKKQKSVLTNYFATNSRFAKPRTIETLVKGIEQGLEPRTLDISEILKIQSDSLIKSANDSILAETLKKMRYNKEILLQPSHKAPSDWIEIDHPALNKAVYAGSTDNGIILSRRSVKVHPAVAEIIAPVFEVQKADNLGWKIYDNINGTLKQVQLGFSGFHGFALTESSIGNSYLKNTLKHLNPKEFVDAIKNGNYDIFKQEKIAKDGIENGLKLGTPSDLNRSNVEKFLGHIPFVGKLTEVNNKILWDCLHNSFKIEAYKIKCDEIGKSITTEQKRAIAQWVNDSFGGQAWELLGVKNSTVKGLSRALLSPDWLISTTRQFMGMTENVPMSKWIENCDIRALRKFAKISGVSDISDNIGVRGKSARKFWATAMVFSVLFYNLINAMFRAKDKKEHPEYYSDNSLMSYTIWDNALPGDKFSTKIMPYIFIGRNKDGSARYLRLGKQFREVPELMSEPVSKLSMKSATVPSAIANVGLGYSIGDVPKKLAGKDTDVYYNQEIWNGYGKFAKKKQGLELAKGMGKTALKSVAPFIVNNAMNDKHNMSAWDMFAQTSNGLGYTKAKNQYLYAYEHGNNQKDFEKITQRGIQDGMSYKKLKSAKKKAKTEYTQDLVNKYSAQYVNALKEQNQSKINKVADKLEKENVPANIRVKVYKSALKEYRKSVK